MKLLLRRSGEDAKYFSKHGTTAFVSISVLLLLISARFLTCHRWAVRDHGLRSHVILQVMLMSVVLI